MSEDWLFRLVHAWFVVIPSAAVLSPVDDATATARLQSGGGASVEKNEVPPKLGRRGGEGVRHGDRGAVGMEEVGRGVRRGLRGVGKARSWQARGSRRGGGGSVAACAGLFAGFEGVAPGGSEVGGGGGEARSRRE